MYITDKYMYRSWNRLQDDILPEATFFLGDLFDGGREWGGSRRPGGHLDDPKADADWRTYGDKYWYQEFERFMGIFRQREGQQVISSIPGNHDVGIGDGIDMRIYHRFVSMFGSANREVIVGNHSFVLLDTVSLSNTNNDRIHKPAQKFLKELQSRPSYHPYAPFEQDPTPISASDKDALQKQSSAPKQEPLPRILLSHVPFYRPPNEPCGPFRTNTAAIRIGAGFQYQNVLHASLSTEILQAVDPILVLSGDDHDSCEIIHRETKRIKEITVRSFSMVMEVRRPGFLLLSAWNPSPGSDDHRMEDTVQTHVCYLPDELGMLINYGIFAGLTLLVILIRALFWKIRPTTQKLSAPLPLYTQQRTSRSSYAPLPAVVEEEKDRTKSGWRGGWKGTRGGRALREVKDICCFGLAFYLFAQWMW